MSRASDHPIGSMGTVMKKYLVPAPSTMISFLSLEKPSETGLVSPSICSRCNFLIRVSDTSNRVFSTNEGGPKRTALSGLMSMIFNELISFIIISDMGIFITRTWLI